MFGIFKKKPESDYPQISLTIQGMHCTSCAMNIDGELEDLDGVVEASTNYAKSVSQITFNSDIISVDKIQSTIKELGYDSKVS